MYHAMHHHATYTYQLQSAMSDSFTAPHITAH
jgi:hypothetical protein